MPLETKKYARKPFYVDAVQVTEENIEAVAKWCQGTIEEDGDAEGIYIKVKVHRPLTDRQTRAFIGDWVLYAGTGYKVYTPKAFEKSFEVVRTLTKAQADEAGIFPPIEPRTKPVIGKPAPPKMVYNTIPNANVEVGEIQASKIIEADPIQAILDEADK